MYLHKSISILEIPLHDELEVSVVSLMQTCKHGNTEVGHRPACYRWLLKCYRLPSTAGDSASCAESFLPTRWPDTLFCDIRLAHAILPPHSASLDIPAIVKASPTFKTILRIPPPIHRRDGDRGYYTAPLAAAKADAG